MAVSIELRPLFSLLWGGLQVCAGAELRIERRRSVNEAGQLLPQPLEHAALGKQHGVQRQAQRLRDLHSRLAFRDVTTERLPRDRGEVTLHTLYHCHGDVLVML